MIYRTICIYNALCPPIVFKFKDTPGKIIDPSPILTDLSIFDFLFIILSQFTLPNN